MRKITSIIVALLILSFAPHLMAAISLVGTPSKIGSGSGYTPGAGSNRAVVMVVTYRFNTGTPTITNISYNGVTRTPTVQTNDGWRDGAGVLVFKESELPAGSSNATITFSGATEAALITCYTFDGVDQTTTVRTSNSGTTAFPGTTLSITLSGLTVGDMAVGGAHDESGTTFTHNNSFTEVTDQVDGGSSGQNGSGYKTAASTSESYSVTTSGSENIAGAALALIPYAAGGGTIVNPLSGKGGGAARPLIGLKLPAANDDHFHIPLRASR